MSKTLHVVFKTHLDVGFTDYAAAVKQLYFERYIPQALRIARELRDTTGCPDRFVWTTGSWIIYEYLEHATGASAPAPSRQRCRMFPDTRGGSFPSWLKGAFGFSTSE